MAVRSPREELIARIQAMNEEQISILLKTTDILQGEDMPVDQTTLSDDDWKQRWHEVMQSDTLPDDYDPDNDPSVGFFSGPPDLGIRTKEILQAEVGRSKSPATKTIF